MPGSELGGCPGEKVREGPPGAGGGSRCSASAGRGCPETAAEMVQGPEHKPYEERPHEGAGVVLPEQNNLVSLFNSLKKRCSQLGSASSARQQMRGLEDTV